jgi:hypothetical protein
MRNVAFVIASLCAAPALHATVLVPAEFREIVTGSQIIVYGRVAELRPEWSDGRRRIDTVVTLTAGTFLKGGPGETVTFRVPGGQIGRYRSTMVGAPAFRAGDEVVVFLRADGPAIPHVFGFNQGVFRVRRSADTGERLVVPPALMARGETPAPVVRGVPEQRVVPLDAFGAQIRGVLAETAGGVPPDASGARVRPVRAKGAGVR